MFGRTALLVSIDNNDLLSDGSLNFRFPVNEIVSRQEPHVNEDQLSLAVNIRDHAATPEISPDSDPVLVEVIHKCLKADPKDRPVRRSRCKYSIAILYL